MFFKFYFLLTSYFLVSSYFDGVNCSADVRYCQEVLGDDAFTLEKEESLFSFRAYAFYRLRLKVEKLKTESAELSHCFFDENHTLRIQFERKVPLTGIGFPTSNYPHLGSEGLLSVNANEIVIGANYSKNYPCNYTYPKKYHGVDAVVFKCADEEQHNIFVNSVEISSSSSLALDLRDLNSSLDFSESTWAIVLYFRHFDNRTMCLAPGKYPGQQLKPDKQHYFVNERVTYSCKDGEDFINPSMNKTLLCLGSLGWSEKPPICGPKKKWNDLLVDHKKRLDGLETTQYESGNFENILVYTANENLYSVERIKIIFETPNNFNELKELIKEPLIVESNGSKHSEWVLTSGQDEKASSMDWLEFIPAVSDNQHTDCLNCTLNIEFSIKIEKSVIKRVVMLAWTINEYTDITPLQNAAPFTDNILKYYLDMSSSSEKDKIMQKRTYQPDVPHEIETTTKLANEIKETCDILPTIVNGQCEFYEKSICPIGICTCDKNYELIGGAYVICTSRQNEWLNVPKCQRYSVIHENSGLIIVTVITATFAIPIITILCGGYNMFIP